MQQYDILSQKELHSQLPEGEESSWYEFTHLVIVSGKVAISDPYFYRDIPRPPTFDVRNGLYQVAIKLITYPENDVRVSRIRIVNSEFATKGKKLDEVGVDFGQVGVFDPILLDELSEQMSPEKGFEVFAAFDTDNLFGVAHFDEDVATMPFVSSGFGDGGYPIFDLLHNDQRVGLEVVFIGDELFDESPFPVADSHETDEDAELRHANAIEFFRRFARPK